MNGAGPKRGKTTFLDKDKETKERGGTSQDEVEKLMERKWQSFNEQANPGRSCEGKKVDEGRVEGLRVGTLLS